MLRIVTKISQIVNLGSVIMKNMRKEITDSTFGSTLGSSAFGRGFSRGFTGYLDVLDSALSSGGWSTTSNAKDISHDRTKIRKITVTLSKSKKS